MNPYNDENGGPAFPISIPGCGDNGLGGMTLRDWFAGQALAGMNASITNATSWPCGDGPRIMAVNAYAQADAMLAARKNV